MKMQPTHYQITVDGILPAEELEEFVGLKARYGEGVTVFDGMIRDQAALVGTVARIEALGGKVRAYRPTEQLRESGSPREPDG
jgi:hypothetical protein